MITAKAKTALFAVAFSCVAGGVTAQTIHTSVDDAGRVLFTDLPALTPRPQTEAAPAVEAPRAPDRGVGSRRAAVINANEAERRLAQAQLRRKQGMAPLPGEQARGAPAGTVNQRYWRRQEKLRLLVEQAQRRSNATRNPQLASK